MAGRIAIMLKNFRAHYWPSIRRVDVYLPIVLAIALGAGMNIFADQLRTLGADYSTFIIDFIAALAVVGLTNFYQGHRKERISFILLFLGMFLVMAILRFLSTTSRETASLILNLISGTVATMLGFFFYSLEQIRKNRAQERETKIRDKK